MFNVTCLLLAAASAGAQFDAHYQFDFRKGQFDNQRLVPIGSGATNLVRPAADGLHFLLPRRSGKKTPPAIGIGPRSKIQGDFEITAYFEVQTWSKPQAGYGAGPTLYLTTAAKDSSAALVGRLIRADGKHVWNAYLRTGQGPDRKNVVRLFPATTKQGALRLSRTGETLTYAVAETAAGEFRTLIELPLGTDDIGMVRIGAQQSDINTPVDVLFKELVVSAQQLPGVDAPQSEPRYIPRYQPETEKSQPIETWVISILLAALAVGGGWWGYRRWRG